jgi:uncharacterized membrane protein HdeD (DUF308 family)
MSNAGSHNYPAIMPSLVDAVAGRWWVHLLRGIAAIGFSIFAFIWPQMTLLTLLFFYGVFALFDGVIALVGAVINRAESPTTWLLAAAGILGVGVGALTLMWPGLLVTGLLVYVGAWAVIRGMIDIFNAIRLRREVPNEWSLLVSGLLSVLFGFLVFTAPKFGIAAVIWPVAACAFLAGVCLIALALRLRDLEHHGT